MKQRKFQVKNAKDFISAACSSVKNVNIIHVTPAEIEENKKKLDVRWKSVIGIDGLQSLHFLAGHDKESLIVGHTFQSEHKKRRVFKLQVSKVYDEPDSSDSEISQLDMVQMNPPTVADITAGTFLLIEFRTSSRKTVSQNYRYAGIAQSSLEDDGTVKVLFLRIVGESGKLFKTDENDISFVNFDQILSVLPTLVLKNVRNSFFYRFPLVVNVYEQA